MKCSAVKHHHIDDNAFVCDVLLTHGSVFWDSSEIHLIWCLLGSTVKHILIKIHLLFVVFVACTFVNSLIHFKCKYY